VDNVTSHFNK